MPAAPAQTIRADAAHPRTPSKANVTITEAIGDTFSGNRARTVISRNSHGRERTRSVNAIDAFCHAPPRYPAKPPIMPASSVDKNAAAGARSRETRVPYKVLARRSRPSASVPNRWERVGGEFGASRNCVAYPAGARISAPRLASTMASSSANESWRSLFMQFVVSATRSRCRKSCSRPASQS